MMSQRSGKIINITSIAGVIGNAGQANYAASKAGMIGLTKATAREVASRGITVNAVLPGNVLTEGLIEMGEAYQQSMANSVPLKKLGKVEDIGYAALYFACAVGLFWWSRTEGVVGTACAVVFSLARVAVGFHYPSDIAAGAAVVGISADDAASHTQFKAKHRLPFPLLSDPGGAVARAWGVLGAFIGLGVGLLASVVLSFVVWRSDPDRTPATAVHPDED